MLYVYRIVMSLGLQVELPMAVKLDYCGARDLANSWSVGGRTRHVDRRQFFIPDLKEQGLLVFRHIPATENETDINEFTAGHSHNSKRRRLCNEEVTFRLIDGCECLICFCR
jgi:hypothetical protein